MSTDAVSPLRQRMIEDMNARNLSASATLKPTGFIISAVDHSGMPASLSAAAI
jgi:hypothetical protein